MDVDFSKRGIDRFLDTLKERNSRFTIPMQGTVINHYTDTVGDVDSIDVNVTYLKRAQWITKFNEDGPRNLTVRIKRIDIATLDGVENGAIYYDVAEGFKPTTENILAFINSYLQIDLAIDEIDWRYFNPLSDVFKIRVIPRSLQYRGTLFVKLI